MADLLMRIDNRSVKKLQKKFKHEQWLPLERFVEIICEHVGDVQRRFDASKAVGDKRVDDERCESSERPEGVDPRLVEQAIELFKQIDANGDGQVDWPEFSAFIIELNKTQELVDSNLQRLQIKHERNVRFCLQQQRAHIFFEGSQWDNKVLTVEERSDQIKIHTIDNRGLRNVAAVRVTSNFTSHVAIAGCLLSGSNQLVVSTRLGDTFFLSSFELGQVVAQVEQTRTMSGQRLLRWHPRSELLCSAGTCRGDAKGCVISVFERQSRTGKLLGAAKHRLVWHYRRITALEMLTHQHLAAASLDGSASIWDLAAGEPLAVLNMHETGITGFSGVSLVPTEEAAWSSFWVRAKEDTVVAHVVSLPKPRFGEKISAPEKSCAVVWHVTDRHRHVVERGRLLGHHFPTTFVKIEPLERYVITCDFSGECRLWNPTEGYACVQVIALRVSAPLWVCNWLLTTESAHGRDRMLRLCRADKERSSVVFCTFNQTMSCVVTATKTEVYVWELQTRKRVPILRISPAERREITACCLDDRERKLIVGDDRGGVVVYNLMNGARIKSLDPHPAGLPITGLHFCSQDRLVVSTSWGGLLHLCDEDDRTGFVDGKHSVKVRSVFMTDRTQASFDVTCSAVSFHLKQVATFCERRERAPRATPSAQPLGMQETEDGLDGETCELACPDDPECSQAPSSSPSVVCVWDLEFARLQGVCTGDPESSFVELEYASPEHPLLVGLDAVHKTVSLWCTVPDLTHRGFQRIGVLDLSALGHLCALEAFCPRPDLLALFLGNTHGAVCRVQVPISVRPLRRAVRHSTYRGNRQANNKVFMEDVAKAAHLSASAAAAAATAAAAAGEEEDEEEGPVPSSVDGLAHETCWAACHVNVQAESRAKAGGDASGATMAGVGGAACKPFPQVSLDAAAATAVQDANSTFPLVTSLKVDKNDQLVFVGHESGHFYVLNARDGSICAKADVFSSPHLEILGPIDMSRLQSLRQAEVKSLLPAIDSSVALAAHAREEGSETSSSAGSLATMSSGLPSHRGASAERNPAAILFERLRKRREAKAPAQLSVGTDEAEAGGPEAGVAAPFDDLAARRPRTTGLPARPESPLWGPSVSLASAKLDGSLPPAHSDLACKPRRRRVTRVSLARIRQQRESALRLSSCGRPGTAPCPEP